MGEDILLTDDPSVARKEGKKRPVIGIADPGSDKDWSGVAYIAESAEAVDDDYREEVRCRFYGLPLIIARGNGWTVRELCEKDAGRLAGLYLDEEVRKYLECPVGEYPAAAKERQAEGMSAAIPASRSVFVSSLRDWIASYRKYEYASGSPALWAICSEDDELTGIAGAEWKEQKGSLPEGWYIGYALMPEVRGRGIAVRATKALLSVLWGKYGLTEVYLACDAQNKASAAVAEKCSLRRLECSDRKVLLYCGQRP